MNNTQIIKTRSTFLHVFNTWLLANPLHVLLIFFYYYVQNDDLVISDRHDLLLLIYFILITFLLSLPGLLISFGALVIIQKLDLTWVAKFLLWLGICGAIVCVVGILSLIVFTNEQPRIEYLYFLFPAVAAICLSGLIRTRQFFILCLSQKESDHVN